MADEITIEFRADMTAFRRDVKSALDAGTAQARQFKSALDSSTSSVNALRSSLGGLKTAFAAIGGAFVLKQIGEAALQSAINIDKTRQTLVALTGSIDAANKKLADLRKLAAGSPGVTASFAGEIFVQLKAIGGIADQSIEKVIKSIGRLNAAFTIDSPTDFLRNLTQIHSQGFERSDIKEAIGRVPIFEQLLASAFGTKDPDKLRKLKEAGKLTLETFLSGISSAIATDPRFANIQESIGAKIAKAKDNILTALAPFGEELANLLLPALEGVTVAIESLNKAAQSNFGGIRATITDVSDFIRARFTDVIRVFEDNRKSLDGLIREFQRLDKEARPVVKLLGEVFKDVFEKTLKQALRTAQGALVAFNHVLHNVIDGFQALKDIVRETSTAAATFLGSIASPLLGGVFGGLVRGALTPRPRRPGEGVDGEEITQADMSRAFEAQRRAADEAKKQKDSASGRQRQLTELQRAVKETDELRKQVEALRAGTGKLFQEELKLAQVEFEREKLRSEREQLGFVRAKIARGEAFAPVLPGGIELPRGLPATALGRPFGVGSPADLTPDTANALDASGTRSREFDQRLRLEEIRIQNQVTTGLLSESEARRELNAARAASRDEIIKLLEEQRNLVGAGSEAGLQLTIEIEQTRLLGVELSNTQRFMAGFSSQIDSVGDAFDRFGQNVSSAFRNVRDLFGGLKRAVLDFFNDLVGQSLQNLVRNTLGSLFNGVGGGLSNLFRTPSFGGGFGGVASAFAGAGSDGISAPPSISAGISQFFGSSVPRTAGAARGGIDDFFGASVPRTAGSSGFSFGALGKSFAGAAPFLGLGLGGGLGGQSAFGQIAGSAGGLLAGGAVAGFAAPSTLSAGAAAFFTNPFTIAIGAGLLVGSFFLGKVKQRRQDEEASGQMLTQALQGIDQLAQAVSAGQITSLAEARAVFDSQILGTFRQQIGQLKTKSVRESRLTNQVNDLRNVFDARIPPLIAEQEAKQLRLTENAARFSRMVPAFAGSGFVPGIDRGRDSVLAMMTPGELVLNKTHQAGVRAIAGHDVFDRVGVPRTAMQVGGAQAFQGSGFVQPVGEQEIVIDNLNVSVSVFAGKDDQTRVVVNGISTSEGRAAMVKNINVARTDREL